jgi:hypothetical protein
MMDNLTWIDTTGQNTKTINPDKECVVFLPNQRHYIVRVEEDGVSKSPPPETIEFTQATWEDGIGWKPTNSNVDWLDIPANIHNGWSWDIATPNGEVYLTRPKGMTSKQVKEELIVYAEVMQRQAEKSLYQLASEEEELTIYIQSVQKERTPEELKNLRAFHGDAGIKKAYIGRLKLHRQAEHLVQGGYGYWDEEEQKGCAVGCLLHGDDHECYPELLGIPIALAYLHDRIFEGLPAVHAQNFAIDFLEVIPVGADLTKVWVQFALWLIQDEKFGMESIIPANSPHGTVIQRLIEVLTQISETGEASLLLKQDVDFLRKQVYWFKPDDHLLEPTYEGKKLAEDISWAMGAALMLAETAFNQFDAGIASVYSANAYAIRNGATTENAEESPYWSEIYRAQACILLKLLGSAPVV